LNKRTTSYKFDNKEIQVIEKINEYYDFDNSLSQLEDTSTFVYLMRNESINDKVINRKFKQLKPHISDTKRIIGLNKAKQLLFKEEYFTEELRKEQEEWDDLE
jgi:uncharacterized protein YifE (UPF0438 family)